MDLISSNDTLDFLAKSAPRPWIKKMLLWMIYAGELTPYFRVGRIVPKVSLHGFFVQKTGTYPMSAERGTFERSHFDAEFAEKLIQLDDTDYVEDTATEWTSEDEPEAVGSGFFVYASLIDWDAGALKAELMERGNVDDHLFWDADPHLDSNFENPVYSVSLQGLCFERDVIEMLQPSADLAAERREFVEVHVRRGRPRVWDWEGATMHLLSAGAAPGRASHRTRRTGAYRATHLRLVRRDYRQHAVREPSSATRRAHHASAQNA